MVLPTAQSAFERARGRYKESLTAKELTRLDAPVNVSDLLSQAKVIGGNLQKQRKKGVNRFVAGMSRVGVKLQPFERLLQGACNLSPKGGELLWGSILFILEMANNNATVFDEVLGFFFDMAHEMEYIKTVEDTFSTSSLAIPVIEALYAAIIDFWVEALKYYRRTLKKGALAGIMSILSSNDMAQRFRDLRKEITVQKSALLEAAMAQHHADYAAHRQADEEQLRTSRQAELTKWINAPFYERDFTSASKRRHEGTCDWIHGRGEYVDWTNKGDAPLIVIYGIPGAGKTILSSWLIGQARRQPESIIFYHYFKEADDTKNSPLAATRSLSHQLYEYLRRAEHSLLQRFESEAESVREERYINFEHLWSLFSKFILEISESLQQLKDGSVIVIMLDAMDECKSSKPMVRALRRLVVASDRVKVAVTARRSGEHVDEFEQARPSEQTHTLFLEISADDVKHDIASFTHFKISKIERLRDENHLRLRERIINALSNAENHQGMFLWSYLMCKQIKYQLNIAAIWKLLDHLPKGLDAMYGHICRRLAENDEQNQAFGRLVLQWIVVSNRPLRFAELEEALKLTQAQDNSGTIEKPRLFDDDESFDEDYGSGLLWSRKDIIKSCGDLVTYTGLNEGDQIRLIHLSAKEFFSAHPSQLSLPADIRPIVETYLVKISDAELTASTTCLDYLLSLPLHPDNHLDNTAGFQRSDNGGYKDQYPFFDYATYFWPEHVLNTVKAQPGDQHVRGLMAKIALFISSPISARWLEEYIFLTDTEYALNTIQRCFEVEMPHLSEGIIRWAKHSSRVLDDFTGTLSRLPQMASTCLRQSLPLGIDNAEPTTSKNSVRPIEPGAHAWIYYDTTTDRLFSFDVNFDISVLKCQVVGTGKRLRPVVGVDHKSRTNQFAFCSATVSTRRDFIAMAYEDGLGIDKQYHTVCWKIARSSLANGNDWAQVVFVDHASWHQGIFDSTARCRTLVAFGKDNTLVTPGGIWDLRTKELISRPLIVYQPDTGFSAMNTCFSTNGGRSARLVNGEMIEILDISGVLVLQHELEESSPYQVNSVYLSQTGTKLIVQKGISLLWCLVLDVSTKIRMPMPYSTSSEFLFISDEEKVAASTFGLNLESGNVDFNGSMLGIWSFSRHSDGSYAEHADLIYVYKLWDGVFTFNSISDNEVMIVNGAGVISRRLIDTEWTLAEDLALHGSHDTFAIYMGSGITLGNDGLELIMCDVDDSSDDSVVVLRVRRLSLSMATFELASSTETQMADALELDCSLEFCVSPHGRYIATGKQVFEVDTPLDNHSSSLHAYNFDLASDVQGRVATAFSADEMSFACAYGVGRDDIMLCVFNIVRDDRHIALLASVILRGARGGLLFSVTFSHDDPNLVLITSINQIYIVRVQGRNLVPADMNEQFNPFRFSYSGHYLYYGPTLPTHNEWPKINVSLPTSQKRSFSTDFIPPISMAMDAYYVCLPHMLKLRRYRSTGVLVLDHKYFDESDDSQTSRVICVVPDIHLGRLSEMGVMLTWPNEREENLILVIIAGRTPRIIDTGIQGSKLMDEDQWFESGGI